MDRGLISLKFAMLRNASSGQRRAGWAIGAALVLGTWTSAAFAADASVRHSVLTLGFALWLVGAMVGPVLMSGAGVLRADYFALLPISRFALGRGLLASVFVGVAATFVLLALLASGWHAVPLGVPATVVGAVGAVLTWVFVITMSRLVYGALGTAMRTRLGIEIAGVQWGIFFAAIFAGWMMVTVAVQTVPQLLRHGLPAGPITSVLDAIPTSWTVLAVEAAGAGDLRRAGLLLLALVVLDAVCLLVAVPLLVPGERSVRRRRGRTRSAGLVAGGGVLPATPTGAVVMKELRQWRRDPWRALESSTAVWSGVAIGVFALLGGYTAPAAAFSGVIVAIMVSLSACNLYGQDGSAVWQNVVGESEGSVRADVRGRQWALLLVFLPRSFVVSAAFVILAQAWWAVPYVVAALPAVLGAAGGAALLTSAVGVSPGVDPRRRVGPNDANGNIGLQVWVALLCTGIGVLPTIGMITWSVLAPAPWLSGAAAVVGIVNGFAAAWLLGRLAIAYLGPRMPDVFSRIRYARVFGEGRPGVLDAIARATLKGELEHTEQKRQEREQKLARARR